MFIDPEIKPGDLLEIILPLYQLKIIKGIDDQPITFIQLIRSFEWLLNISFKGSERAYKSILIKRKRGETKFLDTLRKTLLDMNLNNLPNHNRRQ